MAAAASPPPPSAAHENKRPEEERDVNNMARAEVTNVCNLQDQEEAVTKMLQSTSMGQYFLGETKMEDFFIPDRTYVPHNKYAEEEEGGGGGGAAAGDELPVLDFSAAAESPSSKKTENGGEPNPQQHHQDYATRKQALISQLLEAAESWGFFGVVNHGISLELISRMQAHAHRFFQLPLQEKLKVSPDGSLLSAYNTGSPDVLPTKWWNESLQLLWTQEQVQMFCDRIVCSQDHHDAHYNPSSFREDFLEFTAALGELGRRIMGLLAEGLGLHPDAFNRHFRAESQTTLRFNYYPPCPHPDKIEGMYEHSDACMISILHQDQVGGLQILRNGKWVGVRPDPASFVVNIGEMVTMMSNERFSSVVHRAVANSSEPRLSMVCFCVPVHEDVLTVAEGSLMQPILPDSRPSIGETILQSYGRKIDQTTIGLGKHHQQKHQGKKKSTTRNHEPMFFFPLFLPSLEQSPITPSI